MSHEVCLVPSGKKYIVEEGESLLEAARSADICLAHNCQNGRCGSCKALLLGGNVKQLAGQTGLSSSELAKGYILTCVTAAMSDMEIEVEYYPELSGIEPSIYPCKISEVNFPSVDIAILRLRFSPNSRLEYLPGQHVDLICGDLRRSYSIANMKSSGNGIELHIARVPGGEFSQLVFTELNKNGLLFLEGPFGTFFVRENDHDIIFLAGGTGIAPIKAMIEQLVEHNSNRTMYVYWGARSADSFYSSFLDILEENNKNISYIPVCSGNDKKWAGRVGLVHEAVLADFDSLSSKDVYVCGSPEMISVAKKDFVKHGLNEKNFYADAFTAS